MSRYLLFMLQSWLKKEQGPLLFSHSQWLLLPAALARALTAFLWACLTPTSLGSLVVDLATKPLQPTFTGHISIFSLTPLHRRQGLRVASFNTYSFAEEEITSITCAVTSLVAISGQFFMLHPLQLAHTLRPVILQVWRNPLIYVIYFVILCVKYQKTLIKRQKCKNPKRQKC